MKSFQDVEMVDEEENNLKLIKQHAAFVKKFGREPGPTDPVFFDPHCDIPTPLSDNSMESIYHDVVLSTSDSFSKKDN